MSASCFSCVSCQLGFITVTSFQHAAKINLKCVCDIDFYGELNYLGGLHAAESGDCFENSLSAGAFKDTQTSESLRGDCSEEATFRCKIHMILSMCSLSV